MRKYHNKHYKFFAAEVAFAVQNQLSAVNNYAADDCRSEKFAQRTGQRVAARNFVHDFKIFVRQFSVAREHLFFGIKRLHNTQSAQTFFQNRENFACFFLCLMRFSFQILAYLPDNQADNRNDQQHKNRQSAADVNEIEQIENNRHRVAHEHFHRVRNRKFYFLYIARCARHNVAFAFFGKKLYGQAHNFVINAFLEVAHGSVHNGSHVIACHVSKYVFQ